MIVGIASDDASTTFRASMNREISPPDAILFNDPGGAPGLIDTVKLT